jgi:peptide/nickel transport system substrate-binding protein/microcin C transport system substrate-binding protein
VAADEVDPARRRLALALAGTPWAGAVGAAASMASGTSAAAPVDARGAARRPGPGAERAPAAAPADLPENTGRWLHAFAAFGPPKYGPGFTHFEYVNPGAPRGGTLRLRNPDRRTSFDKLNPWTTRGNAPAGILVWMVEGLAHMSQDEPATMYALLAEAILVAPDFSSVSFRIRPTARFNNGDAVTPEDVVSSLARFKSKGASPAYQTAVAGIERAVLVDARTVRFDLAEKSREQVLVAGNMPVLSRKWGGGKPMDEIVTEHPITTGAYLIDKVDMPRRIEYRLDPDYWGKDHPARRGHFNWQRVVYRMYQEHAIAREAFKAGEFDIYKEYGARSWARLHSGPKWNDGRIVKMPLETAFGQGLQAVNLNLRRPIFQDIRVREALNWTYDFETLNKTGIFRRAYSVFSNSEFAAEGMPSAGEIKLLEPFRAELPPRVFGPAFRPPRTDGEPNGLRRNLLRARALLDEAGWKLDAAGDLRNAQGEKFEVEYLTPRESGIDDWQRNLRKLGITLKERVVDFALYRRRLEKYDYDMIVIVEGDFTLPSAGDLRSLYGSKSAAEEGNNNFRGVKSAAADALVEAIAQANTMQELRDAARAFDRVVMWNFWQVPELYLNVENISVWNRFGIPKVQARFFAADFIISGFQEHGPWPLWCWWDKALEGRPDGRPASKGSPA